MIQASTGLSNSTGGVYRPRILVIEDEEMMRKLLKDYLQSCGFEISAFSEGESALKALHEKTYAAVVSDIFLPGKRGFTLLQTIKAENPGAPVILISGETPETVAETGDVSMADAFLRKPFDMGELKRCLSQLGVLPPV
jgi:DNA-binding response OmpR family regulator